ncbi:MAG: tetratricopeptide repeat protein [Thermodesulfobacteriota bacterium]
MDSLLTREDFLGADGLEAWKQLARHDPASPALLPLARAYLFREEPARALEISQRVSAAHPYHLEAALLAARALVDLNRTEEARSLLGQTSCRLTDLAEHLEEIARLLAAVGDAAGAARAGEAARLLKLSGEAGPAEEAVPEAEPEVAGVAEAIPTETMAALYLNQGHPDKALEIYRLLVHQNPQDDRIRLKLEELIRSAGEAAPAGLERGEIAGGDESGLSPPVGGPGPSAAAEVFEEEAEEGEEEDWMDYELPPLVGPALFAGEAAPAEAGEKAEWEALIPTTISPGDTIQISMTELGLAADSEWSELIPPTLEITAGPPPAFAGEVPAWEEPADREFEGGRPEMIEPERETATWEPEAVPAGGIEPEALGTPEPPVGEEVPSLEPAEPAEMRTAPAPPPDSRKKLAGQLERLRLAARRRREAVHGTLTP